MEITQELLDKTHVDDCELMEIILLHAPTRRNQKETRPPEYIAAQKLLRAAENLVEAACDLLSSHIESES